MVKIEDFCYAIDLEAPNHFELLKNKGKLPVELETKEGMDEKQQVIYNDYVNQYKK